MNFLMVGHTHEDVDQVFSLLVSQVIRRHRYETVGDLREYMEAVLGPGFERGNEHFMVRELKSVRTFADWLKPLGVTQHGCWQSRQGIEAPHSFTYKLFMDLTGEEKAVAKHHGWMRARGERSEKDVMCCVKTYMRDRKLQQEPLCVLPASRLDSLMSLSPAQCVGPSMSSAQIEHYHQVATVIDNPIYGYHRAAAALRELCAECSQSFVIENQTPWLHSIIQDRGPLLYPDKNPFFSHLPESSWNTKVQIRR